MTLPKMTKDTELWNGVTQRLYVYRNANKIDDILGRVWGKLITSFEESEGKGTKRLGKLTAKLGGLAALLGIGEAGGEYGFEGSREKVNKQLSTLTYDNKITILLDFFSQYDQFRYPNLLDGVESIPPKADGVSFPLWKVRPLKMNNDSFVGYMSGLFLPPIRIVPEPDGTENAANEILEGKKSLWEWRTIEKSIAEGSIPWIAANFNQASQASIIVVANSEKLGIPIHLNSFGLITCKDRVFTCDPISMSIHY